MPEGKIGKKKMEKLQMKAETKKAREAEEREREEEARRKEEKEQREEEEYQKLKAAFSIDESGFDEEDAGDGEGDRLRQFVEYIKTTKVVLLEDLAAHFKLKTQEAIDRVTALQEEGTLTGVIDDRGKFIYISSEELESVAKFIRQRGRVSIAELAECSNKLINLTPESTAAVSS